MVIFQSMLQRQARSVQRGAANWLLVEITLSVKPPVERAAADKVLTQVPAWTGVATEVTQAVHVQRQSLAHFIACSSYASSNHKRILNNTTFLFRACSC